MRKLFISGFYQFGGVSRTVIAEKQHFGPFWATKLGVFESQRACYFDVIPRKIHPSIIIDNRKLFIYGFHQFGGGSRTIIVEKQHFWPFWAPKKGFSSVLGAYYFHIIARKRHSSIIIDIRNLFTYGFHQFVGVSGRLLLEKQHFGPFQATEKRVFASQGLTIFISLHGKDTQVS